jgi:hypothetical protein
MKKRKIFFTIIIIVFGYWFLSNVKELYDLMSKYPKEFKQQRDFSLIRFYNTYKTLSYSEVMIKRGRLHHDYCLPTGFKDANEQKRLSLLIEEDYQEKRGSRPDWPASLGNIERFKATGPNCLKESKLINFEFKCKEAYATYACESDDYVREFTYTANGGEKCFYIGYKKTWGIEPKRTIEDTKRFFIGGVSDSIFDSPECGPTNR